MSYIPVIRHFIHQAILHSGRGVVIDFILSTRCEVIWFLDLIRPYSLSNSNHPEEFVDVVPRVAKETTEYDKDVVDIMLAQNGIRDLFAT